MSRSVILVPHDPTWPRLALEEASRISSALGNELIAVHHIGSTAIPGIKAKPILDFLGVVRRLQFLDENPGMLEQIDYRARGEMGVPGRRYFSKSANGPRTHHIHFFQLSDPNIERYLLFRDYLVAHPLAAERYERLKEDLARHFPNDISAYTDAKNEFIRATEQAATRWREAASA